MLKLIGLSGSLRQGSFNTALLQAAAGMMPDGSEMAVHTVRGIPLYDADAEAAAGIPAAVTELKEAIAMADGLILASPEYNNSIPGVTKNALDWLTRPPADIPRVFHGKPIAVIGATPGGFGTILAQNEWLPILRYLGTRPWFGGRLLVSRANTLFDTQGQLTDEKTQDQLRQFLHGFIEFTQLSANSHGEIP
ncbi:MAG: NAD(P)H-dependent oxidoreductase [Planctomycetota bacterium]|nr:MAG: NAD(P)H-dependent oxidoreductase [Planctomycetota bacterium]